MRLELRSIGGSPTTTDRTVARCRVLTRYVCLRFPLLARLRVGFTLGLCTAALTTACGEGEDRRPGYVGVLTLPPDEDAESEEDTSSAELDAGGDASVRAESGVDAGPGMVSTSVAGGIGQTCERDSDCPDGLSCREDVTSYVAHHQCTRACKSGAECTAFAEGTMCIGAEVCTLRCRTDADCPSKTHCIDAGWCKREGKGSGVPSCSGLPTPCFGRSSAFCLLSLGCSHQSSNCSGFSDSCFTQSSSIACSGVQGCYWSSSSSTCSGSAWSCDLMLGSASCVSQRGCSWRAESCSGLARPCSELAAAACALQPGCSLQFD